MNIPKYKIGDVVYVKSKIDKEKICQGFIKSAETTIDGRDWFYEIYIPLTPSEHKSETVYSYEVDSGDAKSLFVTYNTQ